MLLQSIEAGQAADLAPVHSLAHGIGQSDGSHGPEQRLAVDAVVTVPAFAVMVNCESTNARASTANTGSAERPAVVSNFFIYENSIKCERVSASQQRGSELRAGRLNVPLRIEAENEK